MSALEAWTVTALGMAVVYIGLVACIGFIQLFGVLAQRVAWGEPGHAHGGAAPPAPVPPAAEALALPTAEPVPGPVLAVIAAVLEVEHALYMNRPGSRVTIRRPTS